MKISQSTILIVDDDEEIVNHVTRILASIGASVLSACDVDRAILMLQGHDPHLIISDLNMSPISGFEFLKRLKSDKRLSQIPVVVLSAVNEKKLVYSAIQLGAQDYILKPINAVNFVSKVRKALKEEDFLRHEFPAGEVREARLSVSASIHSVGEIGFRVVSNACLNICPSVALKDALPELPEINEVRFAVQTKGFSHVRGLYLNELIAVPAGPTFSNLKERLTK